MDVCAPKDGFVVKLFVHDHDQIQIGDSLLKMDSEAEDRNVQHVQKMDSVREIWAAQYTGPQLDLLRAIATIAIDLAREKVTESQAKLNQQKALSLTGAAGNGVDILVAKSEYAQSQIELAKAEAQQKQLEYTVTRHVESSALVKQMTKDQLEFIAKKKERLSITAPSGGKVKLRIAEGSFAKRGSVLAEIA
jgi:multidrug efflux pump subunit AcrA (membrane-fusion protein)